jgi:hypothetical protein
MRKKKLLKAILIELKQINFILKGDNPDKTESLKSVRIAYKQRQEGPIDENAKSEPLPTNNFMANVSKAIEYLKENEPKMNMPQVGELEALSRIEK